MEKEIEDMRKQEALEGSDEEKEDEHQEGHEEAKYTGS